MVKTVREMTVLRSERETVAIGTERGSGIESVEEEGA